MANIQRCPECNSVNLTHDEEKGELICNDCGLLIEEKNGIFKVELENLIDI